MKKHSTFLALALLLLAGACGKSNKSGGSGQAPTLVQNPANINVPLPPNASDLERGNYLLALVNRERTERGGLEVSRDATLDAIALAHAQDQAHGRLSPIDGACRAVSGYSRCISLVVEGPQTPEGALRFWRSTGGLRKLRGRDLDIAGVAVVQSPMDGVRDPRLVSTWLLIVVDR
jgi:hypothetical protein